MNKNLDELLEIMNSFNEKYEIYNCKKPSDTVYFNILISCFSELIISKKFLKRNKDVIEFLQTTLELSFPNYVNKNRSLILGRTIKYLSEIESVSEVKDILNKIYRFMYKMVNDEQSYESTWQDVIDSLKL
jgi:hypothetical protein